VSAVALDGATLLLDCFAPGRRGRCPADAPAPTSKRRSLPGRSPMRSSPTPTPIPLPVHSGSTSSSTGLGEGDARCGSAFRNPLTVRARLLDSPLKIGRFPRSLALPADRSPSGRDQCGAVRKPHGVPASRRHNSMPVGRPVRRSVLTRFQPYTDRGGNESDCRGDEQASPQAAAKVSGLGEKRTEYGYGESSAGRASGVEDPIRSAASVRTRLLQSTPVP
jgi:hypothetical protein